MTPSKIALQGLLHALGAVAYIVLIATFMTNVQTILGKQEGGIFAFTAFLLVFVTSAAVMGILIFVRPVLWYMDGRKKEALQLLSAIVSLLVLIAIAVFVFLGFR